jgi:mannose-6-phosphate isomerase-like protein (cupin superfamily)
LVSAHRAPEHGETEILVTVEKQEHPAADMDGASNLVTLGEVTIRYVHSDASSPYSLLEWSAPPGTPSPPVHIHHRTDEGFYVTAGSYGFELDGERILASAGSHVLVPKGRAHTFWNAGSELAVCLIMLAPSGFEAYFRELSEGLASVRSDDEALELRHRLSSSYDIEVVGPQIQAH